MRIYFCSDLHGSRKCWKKFLNAWKFYSADHIIVGGDITGKFVVPIVDAGGGRYVANFLGVERKARPLAELEVLKTRIADAGQYSFVTDPDEFEAIQGDAAKIDALFRRLVTERVQEWMAEADEKLHGTGVRCLVSAGAQTDVRRKQNARRPDRGARRGSAAQHTLPDGSDPRPIAPTTGREACA